MSSIMSSILSYWHSPYIIPLYEQGVIFVKFFQIKTVVEFDMLDHGEIH